MNAKYKTLQEAIDSIDYGMCSICKAKHEFPNVKCDLMGNEMQYEITFVGQYATIHTSVLAENEEQAEANATAILQDQYGLVFDKLQIQEIRVEGRI